MPEDDRILKLVEDKVNSMLRNVVTKDTTVLNRPPVGGSSGDYKLVSAAADKRLYFKVGERWYYTLLFESLPDISVDRLGLSIDGRINTDVTGFAVGDTTGVEAGIIHYVYALQMNGATVQYQTREAAVAGGIIISISDASAWTDVV